MTYKRLALGTLLTLVVTCAMAEATAPEDNFEVIKYRTIGLVELRLHVYRPEGWQTTDNRPAVAFFFGGGWRAGTIAQFAPHCLHLASKGIVGIAVEYRVKSRHNTTPIDSVEDARAAMRWIRENAPALRIDPNRIAAGGGSAGGHLAAATATVGQGTERPNALILFNPALDLGSFPRLADSFGVSQDAIVAISPLHQLGGSLPPTIIFHGTADTTVPFDSIERFMEKARGTGMKDITLYPYEGRTHGFFNFRDGGNPDYDDTIGKMDVFLTRLGWIAP